MLARGCQTDEDRALRVLDDRHAPGVEDVEHLAYDRSAELLRACRGAVGVLHGDVAVPVQWPAMPGGIGVMAATLWPSTWAIE